MTSKADQLEQLRSKILQTHLPLQETANTLVFGKGNPDARILFIGEAPGKNEDLQGVPFVGAAGKELDKLLHTISLTIEDVYIANILKYRPPNNRDPNEGEIKAHTPFLIEQLTIIQPEIICTLGNFATKFILGGCDPGKMSSMPGITKLHGEHKDATFDSLRFTVFPLYHPAAMLYKPPLRRTMEEDFRKLGELLSAHKHKKETPKSLLDYN